MENTTIKDMPEILNARMICDYLGIGYTKGLSLIKYGGLDYIKIGNTYRITKKAFQEWLFTEGKREFLCDSITV